jgi:hypothetical protein
MRSSNYENKQVLNDYEVKKVRYNVAMKGNPKGLIKSEKFENGVAVDPFLRRRFYDDDNSVEIIGSKSKKNNKENKPNGGK